MQFMKSKKKVNVRTLMFMERVQNLFQTILIELLSIFVYMVCISTLPYNIVLLLLIINLTDVGNMFSICIICTHESEQPSKSHTLPEQSF